jgi:PAS domain S-box-containing protein
MDFDKRKSGISLIDNLPWGSHFCQFYQTGKDLLDIFVPYFRAGLESNELCVWVASGFPGVEDAKKALEEAVPRFRDYLEKGQMEIIHHDRWSAGGGTSVEAVLSRVDRAVTAGLEGLRLACTVSPEKKGGRAFSCFATEAISRYNVIALFAYSRGDFDAIGLMEVVKNHRCALMRNADKWEVIQSSEARTVRDALKRSEEKFQSLFTNMSEGFAYHRIVLDAGGKPSDYVFLEVNEAFERLTSLNRESIIGKRATEALPGIEKDPADWIGRYGKVAMTGEPAHFESYSEPLGRWYSVSAFSPHKGFFAVTFGDITERKLAEESLMRAKEEWELTFDSVPDMIMILDNQHRIMRVNKPMAARLGLKAEECVGLPCYKHVHGMFGPPHFCPHSRTIADGREHFGEVHEERLGGYFLVSTTPLRDKQGHMLGSVHVAHDITERRKAEERILSLNEQLKRKIEELSGANRELEAFSYSVSHDLRSPLRSIDGFSQEILEDYCDKLDENGVDCLRRIRAASQRMGLLIDGLLTLSRISRAELKRETVNLSAIARDVVKVLRESQTKRDAEFVITDGLVAEGDERLLYAAIQNLLDNAWKFTERTGNARIEVGAMELKDETVYFVRDNGAGFDMAYSRKLFSLFQRLHDASEFRGTGIGLATVGRIINRHGGRIWAEGETNRGATFYFTVGRK